MLNDFYVYTHHIPGEDAPFYVGKGRGTRAWHKTPGKRSRWWLSFVQKHCPDGPEVRLVGKNLTEIEAFDLEKQIIAQHGRRDVSANGKLINLTDGGDGPAGVKRSEEYKAAVSRRPIPEWVRQKMAASQTGKKRPKSTDHRDNLSKSRVAPVSVVDPNGKIHVVQNRSAFAQQYGLKTSGLFGLIKGKLRQHHGWTMLQAA